MTNEQTRYCLILADIRAATLSHIEDDIVDRIYEQLNFEGVFVDFKKL